MDDGGNVCFVVMPFGAKSMRDGSGKCYDFDKVYRVIIRRAINEAGMSAHRADEGVGSTMIHTDMFRDLRDRPVVLADLSLDNPNVFYELGMRHVMADSGTVLICRQGSSLPFDVGLSRVVFYDYDGAHLDWEEVERVVPLIAAALQEARRGKPDSPVHALLPGSVMRTVGARHNYRRDLQGPTESTELDSYAAVVADAWQTDGSDLTTLYQQHLKTVFGVRALAILCLRLTDVPPITATIAERLTEQEQNRLANELFEKMKKAGCADWDDMLRYANSYSEAHPDLRGADHAIGLARDALEVVRQRFPPNKQSDVAALVGYGEALWRISSLQRWRYQLTNERTDLDEAVRTCTESLEHWRRARMLGGSGRPGRLAQVHLVSLLLLRILESDRMRPDKERHLQAILDIKVLPDDRATEVSWLRWYQALALADAGDRDAATQLAQRTIAEDAGLQADPTNWEVGRRQYALLRRFIEQYLPYFRDPAVVGVVTQVLQSVSVAGR